MNNDELIRRVVESLPTFEQGELTQLRSLVLNEVNKRERMGNMDRRRLRRV